MRNSILALVLVASLPTLADDPHAHHDHGAPDLGNIGKAHIDTSCNAAAQKEIDRGVALIHSFWYAPAEKSFRSAAVADPDCVMAWWGVAMSNLHPIWAPPTPAELKNGWEAAQKAKALGAKTDREKAFVEAIHTFYADADKVDHKTRFVAYEVAMGRLAAAHPKDREASVFHALALVGLGMLDAKDKSYARQKQAAAILNRVLPEEPAHPGVAHYLIHSFDYPELAALALPAARVYAKLAPGSPHALHMPSHIFVRLGLWDESIASNLASAEKARNFAKKTAPGAVAFDELHAVDYLVYAYLQQGDVEKARKLVDMTSQVTRLDVPDQFAAAYAIGAAPARFALERRQWKEAAALPVPTVVSWMKVPYAEANIHFARGLGAARSGDVVAARAAVARLSEIRQLLLDQKNTYWAEQTDIQRQAVLAWIARAEKKDEQALTLMRAAADLESTTEKHPVTPGPIVPARELLAEMLFELGNAKDAVAEARRVLKDAPNRRNAMALAARKQGKAVK